MSDSAPAFTEPTGHSRLVTAFLRFDRLVHLRRSRLLIGAALAQSVLAPAIDRAIGSLRDSDLVGRTARDLGSVSFAGFSLVSLLSSVIALLIAIGVLGGRATALATAHDQQGVGGLFAEARSVLHAEWIMLRRKGAAEALLTAGGALYVMLCATRDVLRILRFVLWEGPVTWLDAKETVLAAPLVWLYKVENIIELAVLIGALGALLGLLVWFFQPVAPVRTCQIRSARIASSLPAVLDVRDPAARDRVAGAFQGDTLGRLLLALGDWQPVSPPANEADLQHQLLFFLLGQGFTMDKEYAIEGQRIDLVVDETIAIELKLGALRANERNRVMGQSATYAGLWVGRGPVLIVCVNAPAARLHEVSESASTWNRALADKDQGDGALPAPILVLSQVGAPPATPDSEVT